MATRTAHPAHPAPPASLAGIGRLIHVYAALKADASASRIHGAYNKTAHRQGFDHPNATAAWDAYFALANNVRDNVESARRCGILLLCWHGTTALQGGAA